MATTTSTNGNRLLQATLYTRAFYFGTTGQTVVVNLSKAGAAFAAAAGTVAEIANGWYKIGLTAADTSTLGDLSFYCTAASGGPANFNDQVVSQLFSQLSMNASGEAKPASNIKQNAALNGFTFVMTDTANHAPITGKTVTAQRSLGGAGFSVCANAVSELSNGLYVINLAAGDLNAATVTLRFTATDCDDRVIELITQP